VLTNQLGYAAAGPKRAVVQGHKADQLSACFVEPAGGGARVPVSSLKAVGPVAHWRDWHYWSVDFSAFSREGTFRIACRAGLREIRSSAFRIEGDPLAGHTLSDVLYYFKGQRSSGDLDAADHVLRVEGAAGPLDAHGGWYDATGDYGKHLSHLSHSTYFNPQQISLTAWGLLKAHELLQRRSDPDYRQYLRRLLDEGAWGADYLVRVKAPGGSFYRSVSGPGPGKRPQDRRIGSDATSFSGSVGGGADAAVQTSLRSGAGLAVAALARAAFMHAPGERSADYLRTAEEAWAFLARENGRMTNDGRENIVDDYSGLLAASELFNATQKAEYKAAADDRASRLLKRLAPPPRAYWRADDSDRPFFHAADAGLPLVSLLNYAEIVEGERRAQVLAAVRASLEWELAVTEEVPNPFGYARQLVQTKAGARETRFFFPHDTETAPWWQGENARLGSLATAARLALRWFEDDAAFAGRLRRYAQDQLNWILGLNPYDMSMLAGTGRNNPPYLYFGSREYTNAPGGIVNGITAALDDPQGIAFDVPFAETGADNDWRWLEQWLPHASWYLLAVAAGDGVSDPARGRSPAIIAYVFPRDGIIDPKGIAAEKLTHINYAFVNIADGKIVEGSPRDPQNFAALTGLRKAHPRLKILPSVGGWLWSKGFSDMALTPESRKRFIDSAVAFLRRYDLDGLDVDWEYPGLKGDDNPHRPEDRENFTALMTGLRAGLDRLGAEQGRHYLLTFASGANVPEYLDHTEMGKVQAVVDFVNLMTYDFRNAPGDVLAGHHSNLYTHPADDHQLSIDRAVSAYFAAGVPADKLVLGVPFYAHAWGDVVPERNGLYQPGKAPGEEIQGGYGNVSKTLVNKQGYVRFWDDISKAPYLWNAEKRIFITYDDPESMRLKCRYLREKGMAGVMFWQYYSDETGELLQTLAGELLH